MIDEPESTTSNSVSFGERVGSIASGPTFNLIYLVFLVFPWLFRPPLALDVIAGLLAIAVFVPIHYSAFHASDEKRVASICAVLLLGIVCNFFVLGAGVFLVYCGAMAGFCRPVKRSGIILLLCAAVYVASAIVAGRILTEVAFILFMSMLVWFGTLSTAQSQFEKAQAEREHELDTQAASLMERERIGRDLHDLLGHTLTMVALKSDLAMRLIDTKPDQAKLQIEEIQEGARRALTDVRVALSGLTAVSVATELENARKALASANVELRVTGHVPTLNSEQDQVCGLMIREAVTNIIRHTSATQAHIEFSADNSDQQLTVSDNGDGKVSAEGRGLKGLRKRIESLGGTVRINDDSGVSLRATLPSVLS